jgi:hypothetical protein
MKRLVALVVSAAALVLIPLAQAADPSLHEVYTAVQEGRLDDAQSMMSRVLQDHPESAKAHYVDAEVLVRLHRRADAQNELAVAEKLQPGLPFASPESVEKLRAAISGRAEFTGTTTERSEFPWGIVLVIVGAGVFLLLFLRARRQVVMPAQGHIYGPGGAPIGAGPYPAGYPAGYPMGGGGLGSSIVGGLATGAAVGAGVVAGEALANEFMGHRERPDQSSAGASQVGYDQSSDQDFGVSGSDSWDNGGGSDFGADSGGGGGGDWS